MNKVRAKQVLNRSATKRVAIFVLSFTFLSIASDIDDDHKNFAPANDLMHMSLEELTEISV